MKFFKRIKQFISKREPSFVRILFEAFAIVMFWYGTWGLAEKYLFPENPTLSYCTAILVGLVVLFVDDMSISEIHPGH
ncbi:MAG: hypothetical protein WC897_01815 [Candidatus Gracilibacteria bacterium]